MLKSGRIAWPKRSPRKEGLDGSCVSGMVNLTTLAPGMVAAVLDDSVPDAVRLDDYRLATPWGEQ